METAVFIVDRALSTFLNISGHGLTLAVVLLWLDVCMLYRRIESCLRELYGVIVSNVIGELIFYVRR